MKKQHKELTNHPTNTDNSTESKTEISLVVQSLTSLSQVNHNYPNDNALIPERLLAVMEQARPGTLKEYAEVLLEEPKHRRRYDGHDNVRAYGMLIGNYFIAFSLIGGIIYLAANDKLGGAIATALVAAAQMLGVLFKRKPAETEPQIPAEVQKSSPVKNRKQK